jgi:hypothetical protein
MQHILLSDLFNPISLLNRSVKSSLRLIVFFILILAMHDLMAIEIVSVGSACNVARAARHNNLRTIAYPLDWTITSMSALKGAFEDDFAQVLVSEQMRESDDGMSVIDGYGIVYIHDFPTVRYPVAPEDGEIMPVHQLLPSWRDSIDVVKEKFTRRLNRLIQLLNSGQQVALVRYNEMDRNQAAQFIELLKQKFPQAKLILVVIGSTPEFQEPWDLEHVCNIYIDEKDFRAWDGPEWSQAMHMISSLNPQGWVHQPQQPPFYLLTLPLYNPGLFSVFNTVLGALDYYDRGLISGLRIDFGDHGWYFDSVRGSNWWNYYFEPIILGKNSDNVPEKLFPTYQKISFAYESQFEMPRERAYELIQKYIHVLPHITQHIDIFWAQHLAGSFVIGVHYRGTDKLEADPVSYDTIVEHIRAIMADHPDESIKIFVATDDACFATFIREQFPQLLIMRDALRSDDTRGVHMRTDLDPYKKGEDVVIDCLLLSRCSVLIKMASNVSDCSLQFNPNIPVIRLNKSYSE